MYEGLIWIAGLILAHDRWLQGIGLVCSGAGVWWSLYLLHEAVADRRAAPDDLLTRTVLTSHVRSARVVLIVQIGFAIVNLMVLGLPPIPPHEMHSWIIVVVATRKVVRNSLILTLMWAVWRQAQDRRFVLRLLSERSR